MFSKKRSIKELRPSRKHQIIFLWFFYFVMASSVIFSVSTFQDLQRYFESVYAKKNVKAGDDCFIARRNTVPKSKYTKLPTPYMNLGFPKMGTSSLHYFFKCGGKKSTHFFCGKQLCAACMAASVKSGLPPLAKCSVNNADTYAQMDNGAYYPQIEMLEEIHEAYPNATFLLMFRNMDSWYRSIENYLSWGKTPLINVMRHNHITGLRFGKGSNKTDFIEWSCNHVKRVRTFVDAHPSHALVEVDIEDQNTGLMMQDIFGINQRCWKQTNVNLKLHSNDTA